jgi:hypothetical protein
MLSLLREMGTLMGLFICEERYVGINNEKYLVYIHTNTKRGVQSCGMHACNLHKTIAENSQYLREKPFE